jgi:RNA polymerase sigma-70 factor (ECF subfamily)
MGAASAVCANGLLPDGELACRVAQGDQAAFRQLMRRHNRVLYRTARSILKDDAEAEDALQEAYLRAYRAIGNFRGDAKLSTWLVRIVANEALARLRKRSRAAQAIPIACYGNELEAAEEHMNESSPEQPEHAALRAQTRRLLEAKIDQLPDAFRTVFVLRAVEELSVEETAMALDIPEATVRTRFFRARSQLREALCREVDCAIEGAFAFDGERCDRIVAAVMAKIEAASSNAERRIDARKQAAYIHNSRSSYET